MKKQSRKSKRKLFDPDKIAVAIHQAVERDFHQAQHEYCLNDSTVLYALNRQANELRKKYCSPTQEIDRLEDETFDKFFKVNRHMTQINKAIFSNMPYDHGRLQSSTRWSDKVHLRAQAIFPLFSAISVLRKCSTCRNIRQGQPWAYLTKIHLWRPNGHCL